MQLALGLVEALFVDGAFGAHAHVAQFLIALALFQQLLEFELLAIRRGILGIDAEDAVDEFVGSGGVLSLDGRVDFSEALGHVL